MQKKYWIFIALFLLVLNINAQNPQWKSYSSGNFIYSLAEESDIMWVGTNFGGLVAINKSTGISTFYFTYNSGLSSNYVQSIAIDSNGTKWIGTRDGLAKFDGTNWTTYNTSNQVCLITISIQLQLL